MIIYAIILLVGRLFDGIMMKGAPISSIETSSDNSFFNEIPTQRHEWATIEATRQELPPGTIWDLSYSV